MRFRLLRRRPLWRRVAHQKTADYVTQDLRDLLTEAEHIRDRLAEIKNDISALDRTLSTFGYTGNLEEQLPRQKR